MPGPTCSMPGTSVSHNLNTHAAPASNKRWHSNCTQPPSSDNHSCEVQLAPSNIPDHAAVARRAAAGAGRPGCPLCADGLPARSLAHRGNRRHRAAVRRSHRARPPAVCGPACDRQGHHAGPRRQPGRLPVAPRGRHQRQRHFRQPVPDGPDVPRLPRVARAGIGAGPVRLPGRCACQRAVRRRDQLGHGAGGGDRRRAAGARLESPVRPEHAGRRAGADDEVRPQPSWPDGGSHGGQRCAQARGHLVWRRGAGMAYAGGGDRVRRGWLARSF